MSIIIPKPIFSIDVSEAKQDRFKVKFGERVYNGTIEWDADCDQDGFFDTSWFCLYAENGTPAPKEIEDDKLIKDGFDEIKSSLLDSQYSSTWTPPLTPIPPRKAA